MSGIGWLLTALGGLLVGYGTHDKLMAAIWSLLGYTRVVQYRTRARKPAPAPGSDEAGA